MARKLLMGVMAALLLSSAALAQAETLSAPAQQAAEVSSFRLPERRIPKPPIKPTLPPKPSIVFRHGDCSWLPALALEAGWPAETHAKLEQIILRESGCCPNRIGGSVVDKDCNFLRMSTWSHPSDSGLLQINGVHWKQDHKQYHGLVCKQMGICTQEPLLDALTNLKAGRLLYEVAGWSPWAVQKAKTKKP
jgi:hypothetical protein